VNSLLDFSRAEAGRVQARYVATDLSGLTSDLASAFRSAMERGGLRYEVECQRVEEPVYVDRDMWEKIVLNLLSNALKFTFEGFVRISLRHTGKHVELEVEDSGAGVPAAELPRMFERFHRVEGARARTHEGSGIGLALVRDLVALHGGTVCIASEVGRGTKFTVSIPTGRAHLPEEHVALEPAAPIHPTTRATSYVAEALRWVPETATLPPDPEQAAARSTECVLVADDNADMREYIARLLRPHWRVQAASDGEAALQMILSDPPDLVLSDVMMPRLDGFGLVRRLRQHPTVRTIPVILLSARAGEEATGEGLGAGANDYLIKPFSARELVLRVSSQLTIAKIRKQAEAEKDAQRRVVESLFISAPAGITLLRGPDHVIEFANPMALQIWDRTSEVVGKPLLDALPELRGRGFDVLLRDVMRTGVAYVGEDVPVVLFRHGRQETLHLKFVYAPSRDAAGAIDGVAAFGFDVTTQVDARKRATIAATVGRAFATEDALADQLARCCEALSVGGATVARIWTYDPTVKRLELRAQTGVDAEGAQAGDACVALGSGLIGESAECLRPVVSRGGAPFAAYPLVAGGRLVGVLAVSWQEPLSEVTLETIASIADQIALGIDRDASERFRDLFIGMLGHDLRNPLNSVNVGVHVLAAVPALTPHEKRTIDRIRSSASRMNRMITQILDLTRTRAGGGMPIERRPSDVCAICTQVVEELAAVHAERRVERDYTGDASGAWDPDRLAQVFSNLIGNALTYGRPDTPVTVRIAAHPDRIECSVHNFGVPIQADVLPRLFDPFRRAMQGKSAGTLGLGLGLFIAQQIVRAHGGELAVHSSESEGTTFRFELPRHGVAA
jgi:signal transduction histidine kinase/FixJ family two-component response regulator